MFLEEGVISIYNWFYPKGYYPLCWRHYTAVPQLDTWVSQKLCRKCEADSIGQDSIETLKIGIEPVACSSYASWKMLPRSRCAPLNLHQPGIPLQRVDMNIPGPLPQTDRGSRYVLVITDCFTNWTEASLCQIWRHTQWRNCLYRILSVISELLIISILTMAAILNPLYWVKFVN